MVAHGCQCWLSPPARPPPPPLHSGHPHGRSSSDKASRANNWKHCSAFNTNQRELRCLLESGNNNKSQWPSASEPVFDCLCSQTSNIGHHHHSSTSHHQSTIAKQSKPSNIASPTINLLNITSTTTADPAVPVPCWPPGSHSALQWCRTSKNVFLCETATSLQSSRWTWSVVHLLVLLLSFPLSSLPVTLHFLISSLSRSLPPPPTTSKSSSPSPSKPIFKCRSHFILPMFILVVCTPFWGTYSRVLASKTDGETVEKVVKLVRLFCPCLLFDC